MVLESPRREEEKEQRSVHEDEKKQSVLRDNVAFERTCHISVLSEADFAEEIGTYWRKEFPKKIDLSAGRFRLESLGSRSGPVAQRGLLHPQLHKNQLTHLDVSYNMLANIDVLTLENGFGNLHVLLARQNLLWSVSLALPKLIQLNLAENDLTSIPSVQKCPLLETLILSRNRLKAGFEGFSEVKRLKRLDLAGNAMNCKPSELDRYLKSWSRLKNLETLRLEKNPFTDVFKEYQVFVVSALPVLVAIDNVKITESLRGDIKATHTYELSAYDHVVELRTLKLANDPSGPGGAKAAMQRFPRLVRFIATLGEMYEDPETLHANAALVRNLAMDTARFDAAAFEGFDLQTFFWSRMHSQDELGKDEAVGNVSHFLELVVGLMERHDSIRRKLVETLALLSGVVRYDLGVKCMQTLSRMMLTSRAYRADVEMSISHVLVPVLTSFSDLNGDAAGNIVLGLVELMKKKQCMRFVAKSLQDLVPMLVECLRTRKTLADSAIMVKLLTSATVYEPSLEANQCPELLQKCVAAIDDRSISENENHRGLWMDLLHYTANNVRVGDDRMVEVVTKAALHVTLISKARKLWDSGNISEMLRDARTLATILDLVVSVMQRREELLRDCCGPYKLVEFCCTILKAYPADPLVLAAACHCLNCALRDAPTCKANISFVVEDLRKVRPLLQFLGGKKYPDLYKRSMLHEAGKTAVPEKFTTSDESEDAALATSICDTSAAALLAIIELIAFFAESAGDNASDTGAQVELVNYHLNDANREKILLKLLVMENDDVRLAVMRCISKVPLKEIEPEEMGLILKRLAATKDVGAGNEEEILALVVQQLQRFAGSQEPAGQIFRQNLAEVAIAEAYEVLLMNSKRATYGGEEEEEQKLYLSNSIVGLFVTCSKFSTLRKQLRNPHISETLPQIMKYEEELNSPQAVDVALEQTWCGRCLEDLMNCLSGPFQLDRHKKVALRLICRMANIAAGSSDGFAGVHGQAPTLSLAELCKREEGMWDARAVKRSLRFLDDEEWTDRLEQLEAFAGRNSINHIIRFLFSDRLEDNRARYLQTINVAKQKIAEINSACDSRVVEIMEGESEEKGREDAIEMKLEEVDENKFERVLGRDVLMIAVQQHQTVTDPDAQSLFSSAPTAFSDNADDQETSEGLTHRAYPLAALLRLIWALLVVPPVEERRLEVARELRDPTVFMDLLALVEDVPPLSCGVASKFLRVMAYVLDLSTASNEEAPLSPELLYLLATYCNTVAEHCLGALRLARDTVLSLSEQTLCMEMSRLLTVMTSAVQHFRFSKHAEVQRLAVTDVIAWLVPPVVIRFVVAVVIYDLQLDHGGGDRSAINDKLVAMHSGKLGMKDYATQFLSKLLARCPQHKYDVLEVFSVSDVFLHQYVRPSYLMELLTGMVLAKYMDFIESSFLALRPGAEEEHILCYGLTEAMGTKRGAKGTAPSILCCTTLRVYLLVPVGELPPYADPETLGMRWEPSWESAYPREPKILWEVEYADIACIYRCHGGQLMAIEFKEGREVTKPDRTIKAPHELLMFCHSAELEACVECLVRCGGLGRRSNLVNDPLIRKEVLAKTGGAEVLATTIATRLPASGSHLKVNSEPYLFVMTRKAVFQFSVNLQAWSAPDENADVYFDADHEVPQGAAGPSGASDADASVNLLRAHSQRQQNWRPKPGKNPSPASLLTVVTEKNLPPSEVTFEVSQEAVLLLKVGGEDLRIRFYDDAGRELWRRALTQYLSSHTSAWERQHH